MNWTFKEITSNHFFFFFEKLLQTNLKENFVYILQYNSLILNVNFSLKFFSHTSKNNSNSINRNYLAVTTW